MRKRKAKYTSQGWGRMKKNKKPPKNFEEDICYKADKLCNEIEARLRASVKVYSSEKYSQKFLRSLVDQRSL